MDTTARIRKLVLSLVTIAIIAGTTAIFQSTQSFYKDFAQGERYFRYRKYSKALPYFVSAYNLNPTSPEVLAYLLWTYQNLGMKKETGIILAALYKSDPENIAVLEQLADVYYSQSGFAQAEDMYRKILEIKDSFSVRRKLAEVVVWQKKYKEAVPLLEELMKEKPDDYKLIEFYADVSSWAKEYEKAISAYRELLSSGHGSRGTVLKLAEVLRFAGKDEEAVSVYDEYLKGEK